MSPLYIGGQRVSVPSGTSIYVGSTKIDTNLATRTVDPTNLYKVSQQVDNYTANYPELATIAAQPQGRWINNQSDANGIPTLVSAAAGKTLLLVIYAIPGRDNGQYSAGGFPDRQSYLDFLTSIKTKLGNAPAILIYEPDALGLANGLSSSLKAERIETLRLGTNILATIPNAETYAEASMWIGPTDQASLLQQIDVSKISGFAINTSGYNSQDTCISYGNNVVTALNNLGITNKKFTIDSGRNGVGALTDADRPLASPWLDASLAWCNPPQRRLGPVPGLVSGQPNVRATFWVKSPGESDGNFPSISQSNYYGESAPNAGVFWVANARDLLGLTAQRTNAVAGDIVASFTSSYGLFTQQSSGVSLVSGRARIAADTSYSNISTDASYSLVGSSVFAQMFAPSTDSASASVIQFILSSSSASNGTRLIAAVDSVAGTLYIGNEVGYSDNNATRIAYNATTMSYLRWRESSGTIYLDTAPDGLVWTNKASFAKPSYVTGASNLKVQFVAYKNAGTGYAEIDNVNIAGAMPRLTRANTGQIQRLGAAWRTGGANLFQLALNDYPSNRQMSKKEIDTLLDECLAMNIRLVRAHTLGVSVGPNAGTLVTGVSGTSTITITYNQDAWATIDYAIYAAAKRGIYLMVPMTDEYGYYHGGKRNWVAFRRPSGISLDTGVNTANSSSQRTAESYFYTDTQIVADFRQYLSDWLTRVNPYTGRAAKDEPAIAIIETGNELWTSAQDAPTWASSTAQYIKSIAPNVLVADGAAADGAALNSASLDSQYIDVVGTHPYSTFNQTTVTSQAAQAGNKGKAYIVGEYPWSKSNASDIEYAARSGYNIFASAFWSLQNDADLHSNGAAYGSDDVSLYYPGKDSTQTAAVSRITTHGQNIASSIPTAPATVTDFSDTFSVDGTPNTQKWNVSTSGNGTSVNSSTGNNISTGSSQGQYGDKTTMFSLAAAGTDRFVSLTATPTTTNEAYFRVWLRASGTNNNLEGGSGYFIEINSYGYIGLTRQVNGTKTVLWTGQSVPGLSANVPINVEFYTYGSSIISRVWTGSTRPDYPSIAVNDTGVTASGYTGYVLNAGPGGAAGSRTWRITNWKIATSPTSQTVRLADDFNPRTLSSSWAIVQPAQGTGGGTAFTTASMIDLNTSNIGNYKGAGGVILYENTTPSSTTADSDIMTQFTVPADNSATMRMRSRMPVLADGRKGYELVFDCGNGQLGLYVSGDNFTGSLLSQSLAGAFAANPGTVWKMRLLTKTVSGGNRLAAKVWQATSNEPSAWTLDVTDTSTGYGTGYNAVFAYPGSATTSYTWKVDGITILNA